MNIRLFETPCEGHTLASAPVTYHGHAGCEPAGEMRHFPPVHRTGKANVRDEAAKAGNRPPQQFDRLFARPHGKRLEARILQRLLNGGLNGGVVLDHQNLCLVIQAPPDRMRPLQPTRDIRKGSGFPSGVRGSPVTPPSAAADRGGRATAGRRPAQSRGKQRSRPTPQRRAAIRLAPCGSRRRCAPRRQ